MLTPRTSNRIARLVVALVIDAAAVRRTRRIRPEFTPVFVVHFIVRLGFDLLTFDHFGFEIVVVFIEALFKHLEDTASKSSSAVAPYLSVSVLRR